MFFYSFIYIVFVKKKNKFRIIYNDIVFFVNLCSVEKLKWKKSLYYVKMKIEFEKILYNEFD